MSITRERIGVKSLTNDRIAETNPVGRAPGLLRCCGQGLPSIPYRPSDGLVLAPAQSETIQAILCSSANCNFQNVSYKAGKSDTPWLRVARVKLCAFNGCPAL